MRKCSFFLANNFFDLASLQKTMAPICKQGSGTNDDDDEDDGWTMFQLCDDAKSQEVDLLQSGIIK